MISGAQRCSGSITIAGAKNAVLPCMAASILTNQNVTLQNVPQISDVEVMKQQLGSYGLTVRGNVRQNSVTICAGNARSTPTSSDGSKTRGSFLVLGPLLARFREATVYHPGGCNIGRHGRPVDFHIDALSKMGATSSSYGDYIVMKANGGLRGARINFPKVSVGATETTIMAACLAQGQTTITNAAVEPEVIDLVEMLKEMGARIEVYEDERIIVVNGCGGALLNGCTHTVIPDRIEAGTWAIAAAMTGGSLTLKMNPGVGRKIMIPVVEKLREAGVRVQWQGDGLKVERQSYESISPVNITTGPYPDFPTDLLPLWVVFMTQASGPSILKDTIYDNRFQVVEELEKMGARFTKFSDSEHKVHGRANLSGARVVAKDLRAGAALVLAALVAEGSTVVKEFQHVLRGYDNIKEKLKCWRVNHKDLPQTRPGHHGGRHQGHCCR